MDQDAFTAEQDTDDPEYYVDFIRPAYPPLASWLAGRRNLEHLAASFIVEAKHFFDAVNCHPEDGLFQDLTRLPMTSSILKTDLKTVLLSAASVAFKMPKLALLELWYGRQSQACLFRYKANRVRAPDIFLIFFF